MLGMEHGYMPQNAKTFFEVEWFFATAVDMI